MKEIQDSLKLAKGGSSEGLKSLVMQFGEAMGEKECDDLKLNKLPITLNTNEFLKDFLRLELLDQ
jgi:hypothetical protein